MLIFPLVFINGKAQTVKSYNELVAQAVLQKLLTSQGSTFFEREYGSLLRQCMFDGIDDVTLARLAYWARQALKDEPRVTILDINTDTTGGKDAKVYLKIAYRLTQTNQIQNISISLP